MDDPTESQTPRRSPALPIAIVAVVLAAVSAAVVFVVASSSGSQFDPVETAKLAPADTHYFMAFNTDFASDPWTAVPRLLTALDIEQDVRDDLDDAVAEDDLDFDDDVRPVLGTVRRAGMAAQYTSDGGEWVLFIDSRDPQRVLDIGWGTSVLDSTERDDELGLDFDLYFDRSDRTDTPTAVTLHDGIIYIADSPAHISNFIRRQQNTAPLSDSDRFRSAIDDVQADALLVAYANGNVLDNSDFSDIVDTLVETGDVDPRDATLAFAVTARDNGFGARAVIALESGFGSFAPALTGTTDLATISGMTPDDALFLFAGSGLHDSLVDALESVGDDPMVTDTLAPFEDLLGLDLEEDLIALFGNSYGFAMGGNGLTSEQTDFSDMWALGLIESTDPVRLSERLDLVSSELQFFICNCDLGVIVVDSGNYVSLQWPDAALSDATLDEDPAFIATLELLGRDPTNLLFVNISELPVELLRGPGSSLGADPDDYDMDLTVLPGFAVATHADDTSFSIDFVLPVTTQE
jgi:hypothetical protein